MPYTVLPVETVFARDSSAAHISTQHELNTASLAFNYQQLSFPNILLDSLINGHIVSAQSVTHVIKSIIQELPPMIQSLILTDIHTARMDILIKTSLYCLHTQHEDRSCLTGYIR